MERLFEQQAGGSKHERPVDAEHPNKGMDLASGAKTRTMANRVSVDDSGYGSSCARTAIGGRSRDGAGDVALQTLEELWAESSPMDLNFSGIDREAEGL